MLGEVMLARQVDAADFGVYNLVKQALPVVSAIGLLGYDQALTRESAARGKPVKFGRQGITSSVRAILVGALFAIYLIALLDVPVMPSIALVAAGAGVAVSNLISGVLRATGRTLVAAVAQQGYRMGTGIILILTLGHLTGGTTAWALAGTALVVAVWCLGLSARFQQPWQPTSKERHHLRRLGYGYTLGMLGLAASDWVDQALVAHLASTASAGHYAQAKLLTVYPLLSIGSVLGFLALPYFASRRDQLTPRSFGRVYARAGLVSVAAWVLLAPTAAAISHALFGYEASTSVLVSLAGVGALRLLYVLPSAVQGAVGSPRDLVLSGAMSTVAVGIQVGVTILAMSSGVLEAATLGLLVNIVVRLTTSTLLCFIALRRHQTVRGSS